jgi:hypothetical protein
MERNHHDLDEKLHLHEQMAMGKLVGSLPDEEPSLAWRSQLNDKLRAMPARAKRTMWQVIWKPTAGLALAGALAVAVILLPQTPEVERPVPGAAVADAMFAAHRETVAHHELEAVPVESLKADTDTVPFEWNDADLSTL